MGRKKDKGVKRVVTFYKSVFRFDAPLKIIVDGNFISVCMSKKLELKTQLAKTLDENVHIIIPSCVASEISELDKMIPGLLNYMKRYKIEVCSHQLMVPEQCIKSFIGNKNHKKYFVATQDAKLRKDLRWIPGVPLIFVDQNMVMLEKPSIASKDAFVKRESLKQEPGKDEKKVITKERVEANRYMKEEYMKTAHFQKRLEDIKLMRVNGRLKKKAKGANPLSRLKSKKELLKLQNKQSTNKANQDDKYKEVESEPVHTESNIADETETVRKKRKRVRKNKENQLKISS